MGNAVGQRFGRRVAFFGAALALLAAPTARGAETIAGQVFNGQTGLPIRGIDIDVFSETDGFQAGVTAISGIAGEYVIVLPGPGVYTVRADATRAEGFVDQYFNGKFLPSQADPIQVNSGETRGGIDFTLYPGVELAGVVTSEDGRLPVAGIDMDLLSAGGEVLTGYPATTDASGFYAFGGLPPGEYLVRADPKPTPAQRFVRTYFGGVHRKEEATRITLGSAYLDGVDIVIPTGGTIAGQIVAASDGAPLAEIDLDVFDASGGRVEQNAKTDLDGNFELGALLPGYYVLRADPVPASGLVRVYHPGAFRFESAEPISVEAGQQRSLAPFRLLMGGFIAGSARGAASGSPLINVDLDLFDTAGTRLEQTVRTDLSGQYLLGPLPPGNYRLRIDPDKASGYPVVYQGDSVTQGGAALLSVGAGETSTALDFDVPRGGFIRGVIREAGTGNGLSGVDLDFFDGSGRRVAVTALSEADGAYSVGPLLPGIYYVRADPSTDSGFAQQFFEDRLDLHIADPVAVFPGEERTGVDFLLEASGRIAGKITDRDGRPLFKIDLDLFEADTGIRLRFGAVSDADGPFVFGSLPPGTYKVQCDPLISQGFASIYYEEARVKALANAVQVAADPAAVAVNFQLEAPASIQGRVVDGRTGQAVPKAAVAVLMAESLVPLSRGDTTDEDGMFRITLIPPGEFLLRASPSRGTDVLTATFYGDATGSGQAALVTLLAGDTIEGADISLQERGLAGTWPKGGCQMTGGDSSQASNGGGVLVIAAMGLVFFRSGVRRPEKGGPGAIEETEETDL